MAFITVGSVGQYLPDTDVTKLVDPKRLDVLVKSGIVKKVDDVKPETKPAVQK